MSRGEVVGTESRIQGEAAAQEASDLEREACWF